MAIQPAPSGWPAASAAAARTDKTLALPLDRKSSAFIFT
jgi:hypothetical protein